jgi:hypothetical protein
MNSNINITQENIINYNEMNDRLESENYNLNLNIVEFIDDKERKAYIRSIKQLIRRTPEYKRWREFIIETLGFNKCFFTHESVDELTLEVHHHPIVMECIVDSIINQKLNNGNDFNSLMIMQEVMDLHYTNKVGYVVLIKSLHEKFHNGYLPIPMNFVQGNWRWILNNLPVPQEYREKIQSYANYYDENYQYSWVKTNNNDNINRDII